MGNLTGSKEQINGWERNRVLGKGSFGKVYAVGNRLFEPSLRVVKEMNKAQILEADGVATAMEERRILTSLVKCPFVSRIHGSFQDEKNLYLMLEYCPGGELKFHFPKRKKLPVEQIKFYAAELVYGLTEMHHTFNVIHRDLKPNNIMLNTSGHIVIIDFGLAEKCDSKLFIANEQGRSMGTFTYMAPELFEGKSHTNKVDYWSLGVILFLLSHGNLPFSLSNKGDGEKRPLKLEPSEKKKIIFDQITKNNISQLIDRDLIKDENFINLLIGLINVNPAKRLDGHQLLAHPFFAGIDWKNTVAENKLLPPIVPDPTKVNFSAEGELNDAMGLNKIKTPLIKPEQQVNFQGWDWEDDSKPIPGKEIEYEKKMKKKGGSSGNSKNPKGGSLAQSI